MFKPLLAATLNNENINTLRYPAYASYKLDGIRAIIRDGKVYSRNGKLIPNAHVQKLFGRHEYNGLDGELIVGSANDPHVYNKTSSGVMSQDGQPDVWFHVFDFVATSPYGHRLAVVYGICKEFYEPENKIILVHQTLITDYDDLMGFEADALSEGYEGVMVRSMNGPYKQGRSTPKEQILFKLKRFTDSEAEVIGMVELNSNQNEKTTDELGRSKRSHEKAGLVPMDTMGALVVRDLKTRVEFEVGSGFTADQRQWWWHGGDDSIGKVIKYKHFEVGVKDKPRFPVYIGLRDRIDL